jgi:3-oxoacyl-[acyl-carrier-protein] synthase-3
MSLYVDRVAWALGEERRTVEEAGGRGLLVSAPPLLREAGFDQHHTCGDATTAYHLAARAVEPIRAHLAGTGALVYATTLPLNGSIGSEARFRETRDVKHLMDFPASHLQADFGLDGAFVIGLAQQACTGLLGSLRLAAALLRAEPDVRRVLCVTADRFPPGALYEQSYNLISDGAAACLVSTEPGGYRLLAAHAITNGALATASDDETVGVYFSYTHRAIRETLARAGLSMEDIAWIVPQNMNVRAWQILARLLKIDEARVAYPTLPSIGHVIAADNLINLATLHAQGGVRPGDRVLLVMSGYGLNWQCVILEAV